MVWSGAGAAVPDRRGGWSGPGRFRGLLKGSMRFSATGASLRWRRRPALGRLPPQVGAHDHSGQDAQPPLQLLPLLRGVRRRWPLRCIWVARGCSSASGLSHPTSPGTARRDDKPTSPPLPPDIRCLFASLGAWRIEGNPSEGISFVKPSQRGVCADETEPPCLIFGQGGDAIRSRSGRAAAPECAVGMTHENPKLQLLRGRIHSGSPVREFEQPGTVQFGAVSCLNRADFWPGGG